MRKLGIILLIFVFIFTSIPWTTSQGIAAPASMIDSLLNGWLPQPGQYSAQSPFTPQVSSANKDTVHFEFPTIESELNTAEEGIGGMPEDPVSLPSGSILLKQDDFVMESPGFPITIQRDYI